MDNEQQKKLASEKMRNFFENELVHIKREGRAIKFPMKVCKATLSNREY